MNHAPIRNVIKPRMYNVVTESNESRTDDNNKKEAYHDDDTPPYFN